MSTQATGRPCRCNRAVVGAYTPDQCSLCWWFFNDEKHRARWGGADGSAPVASAAPGPVRTLPCLHLGEVLAKPSGCMKCWIRECAEHGRCTTGQQRADMPCCQTCPEYTPAD